MWMRAGVRATAGARAARSTVACVALEPRIGALRRSSRSSATTSAVWSMDQAKDAYQELKDYFRLFDPRHEREGSTSRTWATWISSFWPRASKLSCCGASA